MNKVGMFIDCLYCGDQMMFDMIEWLEKLIVLSYIGVCDLWDLNCFVFDVVFEVCVVKGGVIGIEVVLYMMLLLQNMSYLIELVMDYFEYICVFVGIDYVLFGFDVVYGDYVGLYQVYVVNFLIKQLCVGCDDVLLKNLLYELVEYVEGFENLMEGLMNFVCVMIVCGYFDDDIVKVMGGNVLCLLEQVWV